MLVSNMEGTHAITFTLKEYIHNKKNYIVYQLAARFFKKYIQNSITFTFKDVNFLFAPHEIRTHDLKLRKQIVTTKHVKLTLSIYCISILLHTYILYSNNILTKLSYFRLIYSKHCYCTHIFILSVQVILYALCMGTHFILNSICREGFV